jgi:polysaccharide biosynthesis/export protein
MVSGLFSGHSAPRNWRSCLTDHSPSLRLVLCCNPAAVPIIPLNAVHYTSRVPALAGCRVTSMMRTVILSVFLAVVCGLSYGGNTAQSDQDPQKPPEQTPPVVQSPKPADPNTPAPEPAKPPAATTQDTDPVKMAAPSATSGDKVTGAATTDKSYVIGVDDVIQIVVWGNTALSGTFVVRPDGRISLGLIGELAASGLTPVQLGQQITDRLKEGGILRSPQVTVIINAVNSKKFSIVGEVVKPGNYPLTVPTTVLEALVNAGGFKDFANKKKITIQRGDKRYFFNYNQVIQGKHREQDIKVEAGDLIIVK